MGKDHKKYECSVEGCIKRTGGSLCSMHQSRLARHGDVNVVKKRGRDKGTDSERFWSYVDQRSIEECWPWLGSKSRGGYGRFMIHGKQMPAHRFAFEEAGGVVPAGYQIDHVWARGCARTDCVNPAHLEAVTPRENVRRSNSTAALNMRKDSCAKGHPFDRVITRKDRSYRQCSICENEGQRRRRARRKAGVPQ